MPALSSRDVNQEYYDTPQPGRDDYWRKMAAPRFRLKTVLELIRTLNPGSLVDLGCGNGLLLSEIQTKFPRISLAGIDLSTSQIEANRLKMPGIQWLALDLEDQQSLSDRSLGTFEVLTACEIIEHLAQPAQFLRVARSLARPSGGHLLLTTQSGPIHETERRVGHVKHFAAAELERMLKEAGWAADRVWNAGFPFHDLSKWWANRNPDKSMARFSQRAYGPFENAVCAGLRMAFLLNSRARGAQLFGIARVPGASR